MYLHSKPRLYIVLTFNLRVQSQNNPDPITVFLIKLEIYVSFINTRIVTLISNMENSNTPKHKSYQK